jgi:hypothetical protein
MKFSHIGYVYFPPTSQNIIRIIKINDGIGGAYSTFEKIKINKIWSEILKRRDQLQRLRPKWKNNIKTDVREIGCEKVHLLRI